MPITVVCQCGASYTLKDEYAGKSIKCPKCQSSFVVPWSTVATQADPVFDRDRFLIRQKRISFSTKYFVGEEGGNELLFVHRPAGYGRMFLMIFAGITWIMFCLFATIGLAGGPRPDPNPVIGIIGLVVGIIGFFAILISLAPKLHVSFYRDQGMREKLLTVRQDFKFAILNAKYTLLDAEEQPLAVFHKNYLYNIIRRRWYVDDPDGRPICIAMEDSILLSLLRRFLGPMLGLLRTNFVITKPDFQVVLGEFNRKLTIFDRYVLDLSRDQQRTLDRRVALALGVMLDTGERR
jgi:hypothetical protein